MLALYRNPQATYLGNPLTPDQWQFGAAMAIQDWFREELLILADLAALAPVKSC